MLFADFPNSKFWFPEFVSSYAWHVTIYLLVLEHSVGGLVCCVCCDMSSRFHIPSSFRTQCRWVGLLCMIVTCLLDFMYLLVLEYSVGGLVCCV